MADALSLTFSTLEEDTIFLIGVIEIQDIERNTIWDLPIS